MPLPEPTLEAAKAVFNLAEPTDRRPDQDEVFISAVKAEFPNVAARQYLTPETSLAVPHLVVQSTASRVAVSGIGSEFDTQFYGDYKTDTDRCFDYIGRKLRSLLAGWEALGVVPSFLGLVVVAHFSFGDEDEAPTRYLLDRHVRTNADPEQVQDTSVRIGLRYDDRNFITLTLSNYELKAFERAVFPGRQVIQIRPWEGTVEDAGVELSVDINNRLEAIVNERDPEVREPEIQSILELSKRVIGRSRAFVDTGDLDVAALAVDET
ncbi:MAG: hypothetical protein M3P18_22685 [Actinomycetota bacterium]|nr:hypothetical protein [Actinomycetota bacterium]